MSGVIRRPGNPERAAFGQRIRDQRKRLGMSARALAAKAGISSAYVTSIELGRNPSTGRPPVPSIQVVRRLAGALELDVFELLAELDTSSTAAEDSHVLLYCLDPPPGGALGVIDRMFGGEVDHWLYIADPREGEVDNLGGRATVVRWELGAFPYETRRLDPSAVLKALNSVARSLAPAESGRRVGFASADSSAVMRWVQNADAEVALEKTWHEHLHAVWMEHLGTPPALDVCVYHHEDIDALGLTIDQIATALALIQDHHRVFVLEQGATTGGSLAIGRILERAQPPGVSTNAWIALTGAAAETLATRRVARAAR